MFDFDLTKMLLVGLVALIFVGPKELPGLMRAVGRVLAKLRRFQADVRAGLDTFVADAALDSVDREIDSLGQAIRVNIALNPATAMRGSLAASGANPARRQAEEKALQYASPEMQAYLAPSIEEPALAMAEASSDAERASGRDSHSRA
jgi:sec-independent protein translocase protein TatB